MHDIAAALRVSIGLLLRRLRQVRPDDELTVPESSALARLDRTGPATPGALAKVEQISPQSMGATIAALEARGLVERHADPADGRRVVLSVTGAGLELLRNKRGARTEQMAQALSAGFTAAELRQLLRPHRCSSDWRRASDGGRADQGRPVQVGGAVEHDRRRVHVRSRRLDRHHRAAGDLPRHPSRSAGAGQRRLPAVDDHGVPAGAGRARGHPRPPRRHVRPGQDLQRGLRGLHRRLDPAVVRSVPRRPRRALADRLAGAAGRRRVHADGQLGRDPDRRVPRRPARLRPRHQPGRGHRRPVHRPGGGRPAGRHRLARGVLGQRAGRGLRHALGLPHAAGQRGTAPWPHRLVGQHHLRRRPERGADRHHRRHPALPRSRHGLDQPRGHRHAGLRRRCCWRSSP